MQRFCFAFPSQSHSAQLRSRGLANESNQGFSDVSGTDSLLDLRLLGANTESDWKVMADPGSTLQEALTDGPRNGQLPV